MEEDRSSSSKERDNSSRGGKEVQRRRTEAKEGEGLKLKKED